MEDNRNTPPKIDLREIDGNLWPGNWVWDAKGMDMIAERAAVRYFEKNPHLGLNRFMFGELKAIIAIAIEESRHYF